MVDDMDMKRKKSLALVTGRSDTDFDLPAARHPIQAQRSSSSKVHSHFRLATLCEACYLP